MKIDLKPRKKGGKAAAVKMFGFPGRDEDEEEESRRKQAQAAALKGISAEKKEIDGDEGVADGNQAHAPSSGNDRNVDDDEDRTEEQEMEALRKSAKFKSFSAKYSRNQRKKEIPKIDEGDSADEGDWSGQRSAVVKELEAEGVTVDHETLNSTAAIDNKERTGVADGVKDVKISIETDENGDLENASAEDAEASETKHKLPVSHEAKLSGKFGASVTTISMDRAGNRFCAGSLDYNVKFWDFGSMNSRLDSFRAMEPLGTFPVRNMEFSPTGGKILVSGGSNAARVFDRDGRELLVCPHGDMYLHDMGNTKGHVSPLCGAVWNPVDAKTFATGAADGTIRIWDATAESLKKHKKIVKMRTRRGQKINPTAIAHSPDGQTILAGCDDGGLRLYDPRSFTPKTVEDVEDAHGQNVITTSLSFSDDGNNVLSRTSDDCLRLWDVRRFDSALATFPDLPNASESTQAAFSGDNQFIVTGTNNYTKKNQTGLPGKIVFFDRLTLREVKSIVLPAEEGGIVGLTWHPDINQVLYGTTTGLVKVLYDPLISSKGILRCISKVVRRKEQAVVDIAVGKIYTPNALPMFRDEEGGGHGRPVSQKRQQEKKRNDPVLTKKPPMGTGPDAKAIAGSTLASFVAKSKAKNLALEEDPREALLKMDEKTKGRKLFTGAGDEGASGAFLAEKTLEQEEEEERMRLRKRMPAHKRKLEDDANDKHKMVRNAFDTVHIDKDRS